MRGSDGKQRFSEKERGKVWKDYMERITNYENEWDHSVEDVVEGPRVCVSRLEVLQALNENMKKSWTFRLLLGCGESGHPHMLGIIPDFKHWRPSLNI